MPRAEPRVAETVALGLLQGPTELFPISSSAHIGLLQRRSDDTASPAVRKEVEVALHLGSALALAYDAISPAARGCSPRPRHRRRSRARRRAGRSRHGSARRRRSPRAAGRRGGDGRSPTVCPAAPRRGRRRAADGAWLGLAQALALVPGVSRSGATRTGARRAASAAPTPPSSRARSRCPYWPAPPPLKGYRLLRRRPPSSTLRTYAAGAVAAAVSTGVALRAERAFAPDAPLAGWAAYRAAAGRSTILAVWRRLPPRRPLIVGAVCHDRTR